MVDHCQFSSFMHDVKREAIGVEPSSCLDHDDIADGYRNGSHPARKLTRALRSMVISTGIRNAKWKNIAATTVAISKEPTPAAGAAAISRPLKC